MVAGKNKELSTLVGFDTLPHIERRVAACDAQAKHCNQTKQK
jgi:hypothetical protein